MSRPEGASFNGARREKERCGEMPTTNTITLRRAYLELSRDAYTAGRDVARGRFYRGEVLGVLARAARWIGFSDVTWLANALDVGTRHARVALGQLDEVEAAA